MSSITGIPIPEKLMKARSDVELLAELEREISELQTTIAVLKRRIGTPANGAPSGGGSTHDEGRSGGARPFLGLSILDAARKLLQRIEEPQTPGQIAAALKLGGVHSRSSDFSGIVRTTLFKRGHEVGIEKFGGGKWGLADWRPGRGKNTSQPESEEGS